MDTARGVGLGEGVGEEGGGGWGGKHVKRIAVAKNIRWAKRHQS
jgi:hypothetical protein